MHCPECHAFNNNGSRECHECKYKFPNPVILLLRNLTPGSKSALLGGIIIFGIIAGWSIALFFNNAKAHDNADPISVTQHPGNSAEMNTRIQSLIQKALNAYQQDRIVTPEKDNAIYYIREVLKLDSTDVIMLKLRETIIGFYEEKAAEAVELRDHKTAIAYYSKLLNIFPDDPNIQSQILSTIPKVLHEQSSNQLNTAITQALQAKQIFNKKNQNKKSLSKPPKKDSQKIPGKQHSTFQTADTKNNDLNIRDLPGLISSERLISLGNSTSSRPKIIDKDSSSETLAKAGENQVPKDPLSDSKLITEKSKAMLVKSSEKSNVIANKGNTETNSASKAPSVKAKEKTSPLPQVIIEGLLDKSRREYVHREPAKYPAIYQKIEREGKVILEAIVGYDGSIEDYKILKSDGNPFTHSAVKALKKFKFKPGTFQGKPVKFKIIERFDFKFSN